MDNTLTSPKINVNHAILELIIVQLVLNQIKQIINALHVLMDTILVMELVLLAQTIVYYVL